MVSPEVFAAIVDEARLRNLPIDGHVPLSMRARDVAPHVQSLEHLRNYEMDCVSDPETLACRPATATREYRKRTGQCVANPTA